MNEVTAKTVKYHHRQLYKFSTSSLLADVKCYQ